MTLPLEGVLVVALEQAVAAPYCSSRLADAGARVIKVEREEGDFARHYDHVAKGESAYFVWLNRGKESVCLDIKSADDRALLHRMVEQADVFIQNLAPGAVARLGFDDDKLQHANPHLIICHVSGYGPGGPYQMRKAYDALIQAETGLFSVTGTEEVPAKSGIAVADIAAGMYAYSGILTALLARHRTGEGTVLHVSLFEALAEWMGYPAYYTMGGSAPRRTGSSHAVVM